MCKPNKTFRRSRCGLIVWHYFSLLKCGQAPILNLLRSQNDITIYNVKLFLGIVKRRTNQIINRLNYTDQPSKILAKRDRVPKFNIKDLSSTMK